MHRRLSCYAAAAVAISRLVRLILLCERACVCELCSYMRHHTLTIQSNTILQTHSMDEALSYVGKVCCRISHTLLSLSLSLSLSLHGSQTHLDGEDWLTDWLTDFGGLLFTHTLLEMGKEKKEIALDGWLVGWLAVNTKLVLRIFRKIWLKRSDQKISERGELRTILYH